MRYSQIVLIITAVAAGSACGNVDQFVCPSVYPAAVAVVVRDSVTDAFILDGAGGIVVGAGVAESLHRGPALQFGDSVLVGGSVEGLVFVQVERAGYQPWTASRVQTRLSTAPCGEFITTVLTARLQP